MSGQVRHDLDYMKKTGPIYISAGPTHFQTEKIAEYADYIHTELTHLRRACKEAEQMEESFVEDPNDPGGKQDHDLRLSSIKDALAIVETETDDTFRILAQVMKNKECREALERDRAARDPIDTMATVGPSLKVIDSLKPMSNLKHTATCFEFDSWHDQAKAWSESSNFAAATMSVQKAFFNQIVSDVIYMALEPKITNTSTFKDLLRLAKENFELITSRFDNIQ